MCRDAKPPDAGGVSHRQVDAARRQLLAKCNVAFGRSARPKNSDARTEVVLERRHDLIAKLGDAKRNAIGEPDDMSADIVQADIEQEVDRGCEPRSPQRAVM